MCSVKTMVKIALGIALILVAAYLIFPQFQMEIVSAAPYLLLLACPLAMYFMMKGMNTHEGGKKSDRDDR
jgi:hypothetical protein